MSSTKFEEQDCVKVIRKQVLDSVDILQDDEESSNEGHQRPLDGKAADREEIANADAGNESNERDLKTAYRKEIINALGDSSERHDEGNEEKIVDLKASYRRRVRGNLGDDVGAQRDETGLSLPSFRRNDRLVTTPGAHAVGDDSANGDEDAIQTIEERSTCAVAETTQYNARAYRTPKVFDAELATADRNADRSSAALVVEGVHESDIETKEWRKRKQRMIACLVVMIVAIVGSVAGVMLRPDNSRSDAENESLTSGPTDAPTSEEVLDEAILKFLNDEANNGEPFGDESHHAMAANWILHDDSLRVRTMTSDLIERFALALLYFQTTDGAQSFWKRCGAPIDDNEDDLCVDNTGENRWLTGTDVCTWYGVRCIEDLGPGVTLISLRSNNLAGPIPSGLFRLKQLRILDVGDNPRMEGNIPEELYDLTQLREIQIANMPKITGTISSRIGMLKHLSRLYLANNEISGLIPSEIGSLSLLTSLVLGLNSGINGTIPEEIYNLRQLQHLGVLGNSVSGTISTKIGQLKELKLAGLHSNLMSGTIPTQVGECLQLHFLELLSADFHGPIPTEIGRLSLLQSILVKGNDRLSGRVPEEMFELTKLKSIVMGPSPSLGGTFSTRIGELSDLLLLQIEGTSITGTLPSEFGLLSSNLGSMILEHNYNLTGTLPSELGTMSNIQRLVLWNGKGVGGTIPDEIFCLPKLTGLAIVNNTITGVVSTMIGQLSNLNWLGLRENQLSSTIPTEIGNLKKLISLNLASNKHKGQIPSEIGALTKLTSLILERNRDVQGSIPKELFDLKQLKTMGFNMMSLSGSIVPSVGNLRKLSFLSLANNALTGSVPKEIGYMPSLESLFLYNTELVGSVPKDVCELNLSRFGTDCWPPENPPVPCECCTYCCNRETGECGKL